MEEEIHKDASSQKSPAAPKSEPKLPASAHFLCGWPLLLVLIGGAIGGGLGGLAYGINIGLYKSSLPVPVKVLLNLVAGFTAIGIWFVISLAIELHRQ